jgi:hypothetical protein
MSSPTDPIASRHRPLNPRAGRPITLPDGSPIMTVCRVCGLPARLIEAVNPGESRWPPPPKDVVVTGPWNYLGTILWHCEALCQGGWHRRLVDELEYAQIVGQSRKG